MKLHTHISYLQYGQWVVIHHAQFDFSHESGPYHSIQILLNADSKEFIVRVWGREASHTLYFTTIDIHQPSSVVHVLMEPGILAYI